MVGEWDEQIGMHFYKRERNRKHDFTEFKINLLNWNKIHNILNLSTKAKAHL